MARAGALNHVQDVEPAGIGEGGGAFVRVAGEPTNAVELARRRSGASRHRLGARARPFLAAPGSSARSKSSG